MTGRCPFSSRRGFLAAATGLVAAAGSATVARAAAAEPLAAVEPFWGEHQAGIATPAQQYVYFLAFDLRATKREEVAALMRTWTEAAARMTAGDTAGALGTDTSHPGADSGDALGLPPARLTITFGFGPGLFLKDDKDRYGLAALRPEALAELPLFNGDQLVEGRTGGDICIQACADDPQVAFHAARQLARLSYGAAEIRWAQSGFNPAAAPGETPRNLMGFKDGTNNPTPKDAARFARVVWAGDEGPPWMRGGSYLVARRIRIALEHWDRTEVDFQEEVVGRRKYSGAPIGGSREFDVPDLTAADKDGNPTIPENAHIRLAAPSSNGGAQILRRGFAYNDGVNMTAERWPPWRQGMEFDAGLFFLAYQRDPRSGFIKIYDSMSKLDAMNQFATHVGSGLFACPPGARPGEFIGQALLAGATG
jgi:deferrochelatase/peroxidase EfeB